MSEQVDGASISGDEPQRRSTPNPDMVLNHLRAIAYETQDDVLAGIADALEARIDVQRTEIERLRFMIDDLRNNQLHVAQAENERLRSRLAAAERVADMYTGRVAASFVERDAACSAYLAARGGDAR